MYSDDDEDDYINEFIEEDEENYPEEQPYYGQEFAAFQRTGGMHSLLSGDRKTGITDSERFAERLNAYLQQYREELFDNSHISFLLEKIDSIRNIRFKNPLAYALGYYIVDINRMGKKYINNKKFQKIKKIVKSQEEVVSLPDIIRYARMWEKMS
tara:strand:- start:175 stop:639 length:465 start_codon:yes stop_codon:yes gene_type:complete